jgi:hypothetical protein
MADKLNSAFFIPQVVPDDPNELPAFLKTQQIALQAAIFSLAAGHIDMINVAPTKPRDGDIRLADGTNWNPGSGKGFYGYYNSAWHLLG